MLNQNPIYLALPVQYDKRHSSAHVSNRTKRDNDQVEGYVQLKRGDLTDLATKYYDLDHDSQIFTRTQLVFKTIFGNSQLSYENFYLIALTRHDVARLANATILGFQSLSSEIATIRRYAFQNRLMLD